MQIEKATSAEEIIDIIPLIRKFADEANDPGIVFSSLIVFLMEVAAQGGDDNEVYIAYDNDEPIGFAQWHRMGKPYVSDVMCGMICNKEPNVSTLKLFINGFVDFGKKHKAQRYHACFRNKRLSDGFNKAFLHTSGIRAETREIFYFIGG